MSRLGTLPQDLRLYIASFLPELRPLRKVAWQLCSENPKWSRMTDRKIEPDVLWDEGRLRHFISAMRELNRCNMKLPRIGPYGTGDITWHTQRSLLVPAVQAKSYSLVNFIMTDTELIRPFELLKPMLEHKLDLAFVFSFIKAYRHLDITMHPTDGMFPSCIDSAFRQTPNDDYTWKIFKFYRDEKWMDIDNFFRTCLYLCTLSSVEDVVKRREVMIRNGILSSTEWNVAFERLLRKCSYGSACWEYLTENRDTLTV